KHGAYVDIQRALEIGVRQGVQPARDEDAGVVDQDVQAAQVAHGLFDGGAHLLVVGGVGRIGVGAPARPAQFRHQLLGALGRADVGNGDIGAAGGQVARDGRADTPAAAGNKSDLALQA